MGDVRIHVGEVLDVLREQPSDHFDACLCDPPYALAFMGRDWDSFRTPREFQAWCEAWAREVFRVLKPGASLFGFGGTRTYHRLACGLEDAGFEVRDSIGFAWVHGQGFPKSLDISKQLDRGHRRGEASADYVWQPSTGPTEDVYAVTAFVRAARDAAGRTNREIDAIFGFNGMAGHWTSAATQPAIPTWPQWEKLKSALAMGDDLDELVIRLNGGKGDRSAEGTALADRETLRLARGKDAKAADLFRPGIGTYIANEFPITAPASGTAKTWAGYGTAMKPAWEPIAWAMKPCAGTFAANALAHGVAGINVGGGRLGTSKDVPSSGTAAGSVCYGKRGPRTTDMDGFDPNVGRWPANLVLAHLPDCEEVGTRVVRNHGHGPDARGQGSMFSGHRGQKWLEERRSGAEEVAAWRCAPGCPVAELDEQSGEAGGNLGTAGGNVEHAPFGGGMRNRGNDFGFDDSGGASRFFYCAKADTAERNMGLPPRDRNCHVAVKPLDLCRWLATLLLPPARDGEPRRLLNPFSGSGSEAAGALLAGWEEVVSIERDPEHARIASMRVTAARPLYDTTEIITCITPGGTAP